MQYKLNYSKLEVIEEFHFIFQKLDILHEGFYDVIWGIAEKMYEDL